MLVNDYNSIVVACADTRVEDIARTIGQISLVSFDKEPLQFSSQLEDQIEEAWLKEIASARATGRTEPSNNRFVHCFGYAVSNSFGSKADIGFNCGVTDWKHYSMLTKADPNQKVWGIGTTAVTYFVDKKGERVYVFATRNHTRVKDVGGKIEAPPGGFLDISLIEQRTHPLSLFVDNTEKEFEEELGLSRAKITSCRPVEIVKIIPTHDISIDYVIEMNTSEEELREGFRRGKKYGGEHATQFFIPENRLAQFVQSNQQALTPRTKANIRNYLLTATGLMEK